MSERAQRRVSGGEYVYAELKRRILSLDLEPGQRLYEPALAIELEVSRTPLREGMRRLISENLLEQQPTGGVVVPRLDARDIAELYDVRAVLESSMAASACVKATAADLEQLRGLLDRNTALVGFAEDAMNAGRAIHNKIAVIADNSWSVRLHEQITNQMRRYQRLTNSAQDRRDTALAEHRDIVEAVGSGDPERAAAAARRHVMNARDEALRSIEHKLTTTR
ncbi:MAG: GntR family transcriptional regulator [Nocardioides sp.]|uniref:GntR family transcriptional regulator n=1 Tax=Nocardioides sp. TaxID=35761 RepID=UPI0039E6E565